METATDLLPLVISDEHLDSVRASLPELPDARAARYMEDGLTVADARQLAADRVLAEYFEAVLAQSVPVRLAANWIINELLGRLDKAELEVADSPISSEVLAGLLQRVEDQTISGKIAKQVFDALWQGEATSADAVIAKRGLKQITDTGAIAALVDEVIAAHPSQAAEYMAGKDKMLGFFVGQVMKKSQGKANPGQVNALIREKLPRD